MKSHLKLLPALILTLLAFLGCTTIHPRSMPEAEEPAVFSHESFDRVLQRYGSPTGRVDYAALQKDPGELDRYYRQITAISPDSHPELFPGDEHKLAYWINAYNAAAIKIVLTYYPIDSVRDVKPPTAFFFLPELSGFFVFQKPVFGDREISLYTVENKIVRKRFADPRIHFALNCASVSCPRLPQQAFTGERLDEQLDAETRRFVAEERNVAIDHEKKTIFLSQIFEWYRDDYLDWLKQNDGSQPASLTRYVARYLPADKADELEKAAETYAVEFIPYDWKLNDLI